MKDREPWHAAAHGVTVWHDLATEQQQQHVYLSLSHTHTQIQHKQTRKQDWGERSLVNRSVSQFSHSVLFDSLPPHEPQHTRSPCPSPTPGVHPNPCLLSQWRHPIISYSVVPFSSRLQSFPVSGSFPMNQLFALGEQSIGVSASTSVLLMNTQDWSP